MPKISVIVPIYNCEQYIRGCVDSILNQTFSDFELILVDDGSPDNCGEICEEYAKKDFRVKVIHQVNQGQSAARNNGVKEAQSEWLHFVDSDDLIHPEMLETLYKMVIDNNVKISMCSAFEGEAMPDDFNKTHNIASELMEMNEENLLHLSKDLKYYYWILCGKLIHKSIFQKYPLTEGRIYEDNAIVCKWLYEAKKVAIVPSPLYFYHVNTESTTNKKFNEKRLDILWSLEEQIAFFNTLGYEKMLKFLLEFYFNMSLYMYRCACETTDKKKHIRFINSHAKYIEKTYRKYIDIGSLLFCYKETNKKAFYFLRFKNFFNVRKK